MVDIWYPADSAAGPAAEYFDRSAFDQPQIAERLKGYLRTAYDAIKAGDVRTHAIQGAAFARLSGRRSSCDAGLAGARHSSPQKRWARANVPRIDIVAQKRKAAWREISLQPKIEPMVAI